MTDDDAPEPLTRAEIVEHANEIQKDYERQGIKLTLRQMYYQFVARHLITNSVQSYDRIGATLTKARFAGEFPVDGLTDRGREVRPGEFLRADLNYHSSQRGYVEGMIQHLPSFAVAADIWQGQSTHVSVWVEKDALASIFEDVCNDLGVSWFACKGYPSVSALWEWITSTHKAFDTRPRKSGWQTVRGTADNAVILYFGDHDPDGCEIPRSAERNIRKLMETWGNEFPFRVIRVGLTLDQIRQYNPPPMPAKESSARFTAYFEEHGIRDAWELDALEPTVLRDLIRVNARRYFSLPRFELNAERIEAGRQEAYRDLVSGDAARRALGDGGAQISRPEPPSFELDGDEVDPARDDAAPEYGDAEEE